MEDVQVLQDHYKKSADVKFKINKNYALIYCEGLSNVKEVEEELLRRINRHIKFNPTHLVSSLLTIEEIQDTSFEKLDDLIYSGMCLLYYHHQYFSINVINVPKRTPDQSIIDITITGPRDSLIENLETNVALIRKRLKSSDLHYEKYTIGQHSKTQVGLLYVENVCDSKVIDQITQQLNKIKDEDIVSAGQFRNLMFSQKKKMLFPRMTDTTRPDYCVYSLLAGKFVLLLDNFNNANIGPATLPLFIDYSDDINTHYLTTFITRFLYIASAFIAIFLMPFILALYSYHPQELSFLWLSNILSIQKGLVMPVYLEIIFATFLFELFRVAGTRFPAGISTTLLVIGSVLLGQNITSSGFIGYDIMFLSALSIICNYSISNSISFNSVITLFKGVAFCLSLFLGLYGFMIAFIGITIYICQLKSFGKDMLDGDIAIRFKAMTNLFKSANYDKKVEKTR